MAKVIIVDYAISPIESFQLTDETIFFNAMEQLAEEYEKHRDANYGIVQSDDIASITFDEQNFYPIYLQEALERQGVRDIRVNPFCGGDRLETVLREVRERTGESVEILGSVYNSGEMAVAYQFERQTGEEK